MYNMQGQSVLERMLFKASYALYQKTKISGNDVSFSLNMSKRRVNDKEMASEEDDRGLDNRTTFEADTD